MPVRKEVDKESSNYCIAGRPSGRGSKLFALEMVSTTEKFRHFAHDARTIEVK